MTEPDNSTASPPAPSQPAPSTNSAPASRSNLAVLALVLSLAALALSGWLWFELRFSAPAAADSAALERINKEFSGRMEQLDARLESAQREAASARSTLQASLAAQEARLNRLPGRLSRLEDQLADIGGVDTRQRAVLLRAEALYYLRVANVQASLAGNASIAAQAMRLADDRLRETGDPALDNVRAVISRELAALNAVPVVDTTGMSFRLQALAEQVESWPFRNSVPERFAGDDAATGIASDDGWSRFRSAVADGLDRIISIKSTTEPPTAQIDSAGEALIIEGLRAEFQLARLALVNQDAAQFSRSLTELRARIPMYFDPDSAAVKAAMTTLNQLDDVELPGPMPDISASLSLLQAAAADNGVAR